MDLTTRAQRMKRVDYYKAFKGGVLFIARVCLVVGTLYILAMLNYVAQGL